MRELHRAKLLGAMAACTAFGLACSSAGNRTTGAHVQLHTSITSDPEVRQTFRTSFGWDVQLTQAKLALGALYYFDGPPAFVKNDPARVTPLDRLERLLGIGLAYAHPGHYQAGDAMGQMTTPSSYDLLSNAPGALADGDGITGTYRSGRFVFPQVPAGPEAAALEGHVAWVEGMATNASDAGAAAPIHFRITADFSDITRSAALGEVDGCDFAQTNVTASGTVRLSVRPSVWFNLVDFGSLAAGTAEAPTLVPAGSQPHVAFALGLAQLSAYTFSFTN